MTEEAAKPGFTLDSIPWYTVPAILLGVPAVIGILSLIWPQVFFDQFVAKYYWDPIRNDSGYNAINTGTWAILMFTCLLGLTQMLNGLKVKMNNAIIYGAVGWVVAGANFRVLEDVRMFSPPLQYIMITPPIYLLFGLFGVLSLLVGLYVQKVDEVHGRDAAFQKLWFIQAALVMVYTLLWAAEWGQIVVYLNPIHVALFAALGHFIIRWWVTKKGELDARDMVLLLSIPVILMSLDYVVQFLIDPWIPSGDGVPTSFITAPLLAIAMTGVVWAGARNAHNEEAPHWHIAIWGGVFAATLAFVMWTAPDATRVPVNAASVLSILGFGALLTGGGYLFAYCAKKRADLLWYIGAGVLGLVALQVLAIVAERILLRFGTDLGGWTYLIAAAVIAFLVFRNKDDLIAFTKRLQEQGGASPVFTMAFMAPINLLLIASQLMDGFATSLGLDLAGYTEKHVLSAFLIDAFHDFSVNVGWEFGAAYPTFIAFVPVKLAISLLVVYAIDVYSREDSAKYPTLIGFVKFAIIMVGIGPAVRDFVRLSLGV